MNPQCFRHVSGILFICAIPGIPDDLKLVAGCAPTGIKHIEQRSWWSKILMIFDYLDSTWSAQQKAPVEDSITTASSGPRFSIYCFKLQHLWLKYTSSPWRFSTDMVEYFLCLSIPWNLVIIAFSLIVWGRKGSGYLVGYALFPFHYSWSQRGTHSIGTGGVGRSRAGTGFWPNLSTWSAKRHRKVTGHLLPFTFCSRVGKRTV